MLNLNKCTKTKPNLILIFKNWSYVNVKVKEAYLYSAYYELLISRRSGIALGSQFYRSLAGTHFPSR